MKTRCPACGATSSFNVLMAHEEKQKYPLKKLIKSCLKKAIRNRKDA